LPVPGVGEQLVERQERIALRVDLAEDPLLDVVELDVVCRPQAAAPAVREDAVVELVGGPDAAPLERLLETVRPVRQHPVHAAGELRLPSVHRGRLYVTAP